MHSGASKFDLTTCSDEIIRPWAVTDKSKYFDDKYKEELICLRDTRALLAPLSELQGSSVLDIKTADMIAFESLLTDPNWIYTFDGTSDILFDNSNIIDENQEIYNDLLTSDESDADVSRMEDPTSHSDQVFTARKPFVESQLLHGHSTTISSDKQKIACIKYKPRHGPAILNVSSSKYAELVDHGRSQSSASLPIVPTLKRPGTSGNNSQNITKTVVVIDEVKNVDIFVRDSRNNLQPNLKSNLYKDDYVRLMTPDSMPYTSVIQQHLHVQQDITSKPSTAPMNSTSKTNLNNIDDQHIISGELHDGSTLNSIRVSSARLNSDYPKRDIPRQNSQSTQHISGKPQVETLVAVSSRTHTASHINTASNNKTSSSYNKRPVSSSVSRFDNAKQIPSALQSISISSSTGNLNKIMGPRMQHVRSLTQQMMVRSGSLDHTKFPPPSMRQHLPPSSGGCIKGVNKGVDVGRQWAQDLHSELIAQSHTDSLWGLISSPFELEKKYSNAAILEQAVRDHDISNVLKRSELSEFWLELNNQRKMAAIATSSMADKK